MGPALSALTAWQGIISSKQQVQVVPDLDHVEEVGPRVRLHITEPLADIDVVCGDLAWGRPRKKTAGPAFYWPRRGIVSRHKLALLPSLPREEESASSPNPTLRRPTSAKERQGAH
jgi:hypothetical protein